MHLQKLSKILLIETNHENKKITQDISLNLNKSINNINCKFKNISKNSNIMNEKLQNIKEENDIIKTTYKTSRTE